jgi:hypothetical protein
LERSKTKYRLFKNQPHLMDADRLGIHIFVALLIITVFIGCTSKYNETSDQQKQLDSQLKNLTQKFLVEKIGKTGFGGKAFCAYRTLDVNKENSNISE